MRLIPLAALLVAGLAACTKPKTEEPVVPPPTEVPSTQPAEPAPPAIVDSTAAAQPDSATGTDTADSAAAAPAQP
jgi:hypothetical protein